jgi:hypothetical protein
VVGRLETITEGLIGALGWYPVTSFIVIDQSLATVFGSILK